MPVAERERGRVQRGRDGRRERSGAEEEDEQPQTHSGIVGASPFGPRSPVGGVPLAVTPRICYNKA